MVDYSLFRNGDCICDLFTSERLFLRGKMMEVLTVEKNRQAKIPNHFEKKMIEKRVITNTIIVLQEDFGFTFNDIKRFKKKMNDLERG